MDSPLRKPREEHNGHNHSVVVSGVWSILWISAELKGLRSAEPQFDGKWKLLITNCVICAELRIAQKVSGCFITTFVFVSAQRTVVSLNVWVNTISGFKCYTKLLNTMQVLNQIGC